jgi:hypothetical protein
MKICLAILMSISAVFVISACDNTANQNMASNAPAAATPKQTATATRDIY